MAVWLSRKAAHQARLPGRRRGGDLSRHLWGLRVAIHRFAFCTDTQVRSLVRLVWTREGGANLRLPPAAASMW